MGHPALPGGQECPPNTNQPHNLFPRLYGIFKTTFP